MNSRGITLVEVLVAAALMVAAVSSFTYFTKVAVDHVLSTKKLSHALYEARSRMENLHRIPSSAELEAIEVEIKRDHGRPPLRLYSLRSRYL